MIKINDYPLPTWSETIGIYDKIIENKMITEISCYRCGYKTKVPMTMKMAQAEKIHALTSIIQKYIDRHPEIREEMLKDLGDYLLDNMRED